MKGVKNCFLGIDISKEWFDVSMIIVSGEAKESMISEKFSNDRPGFELFTRWLNLHKVPMSQDTLIVIENTGVYHRMMWEYCSSKNLSLHIGNAARIKWSLGITRGKSDKADSQRLCAYCYRHRDELKVSAPLDPVILQLKDLVTARTRLISQKNSIRTYLGELKSSNDKAVQKMLEKSHAAALKGLQQSLEQIELQIKKIVQENPSIKKNYDLLKSVPGIGPVTAVYIICCTGNFASKVSGKQLACYAGVVPFEHSSGKSVKGKNRVHRMANKELKKLLHMGARSVANHNPEFKAYYERKLKEGKHELVIINAIRNKIVLRAAAVINKQSKYVDNYKKIA
jgi:transposase